MLDYIIDTGRKLADLVATEDAEHLDHVTEDLATRYDRLGTTSEGLGHLLAEMAEGMSNFMANTEDLAIWLDDMEIKLAKFASVSVFTETLHDQTLELMVIFFFYS